MHIKSLTGSDLTNALPDLARLRIEVFREFPYLYEGSLDYEQSYVDRLAQSKDGIIVVAEDRGRAVGCATGCALIGQHDEFVQPFRSCDIDPEQVFYCGESVLLPEYRGRGVGHSFFDYRENHARSRGYRFSAFCAVVRPPDHSLRPANYVPLDAFWEKRGYRRAEGMIASFGWKEIDDAEESEHPMQFWIKEFL